MSIKSKNCMKKTQDNWHPNFENDTVSLSLYIKRKRHCEDYKIYKEESLIRVCVWGEDDFGMERNFESDNEKADIEKAKELYEHLAGLEYINQAYLKKVGFVNA